MLQITIAGKNSQELISAGEYEDAARCYEYVNTVDRAWEILNGLDEEDVYALDFETTALFPEDGRVRLMQICGPMGVFVFDMFPLGGYEQFADAVAKRTWSVFYAGMEGNWSDYHSEEMIELWDIAHMRRAKMGGGPLSLKIQAKRDLKLEMDKTEQMSDWSATDLTASQLFYAALDAVATWASFQKWWKELSDEQWHGFRVINDCWRGTLEMERTGLTLDVEYHKTLLRWWTKKRDTAERYLRKYTGPEVIKNLKSPQQISTFLKEILDAPTLRAWPRTAGTKTDMLSTERETLRQAAYRMPAPVNRWFSALIIFNKMNKYISTYGQALIDAQIRLGRIPTRFNIAQAITCRYSSSKFNLQNIPRSWIVRRSFIAGRTPTGRVLKLVMADYSSIEVRVLAEVSGDETLLHDAIYGDVHSRSASSIFKIPFEEFLAVVSDKKHRLYAAYKDMRSRAKGFTFQLLYGAGAGALAIVLRCSDEEAQAAIMAWARVYPKAYAYRQIMFDHMQNTGFLPVVDGRTIFVFRNERDMPKAANYPIQGAAASVMTRAVYHIEERLRASLLKTRMAATVHDEMLLLADVEDAEETASLLVGAMIQGWLDIFPNSNTDNLVGKKNLATIGDHWGEKE